MVCSPLGRPLEVSSATHDIGIGPVGSRVAEASGGLDGQSVARFEREDAGVGRRRRWHILVPEKGGERVEVNRSVEARMCSQRIKRGSENDLARAQPIVEHGLLANPVASKSQQAFLAIPQTEGEHGIYPAEGRSCRPKRLIP